MASSGMFHLIMGSWVALTFFDKEYRGISLSNCPKGTRFSPTRIPFPGIDGTSLVITIKQKVIAMNSRKHIYYITISDVQRLSREKIGRSLNVDELARVTDKLLDKIQWYDLVEEAIASEVEHAH
jgi:hypothetical protein